MKKFLMSFLVLFFMAGSMAGATPERAGHWEVGVGVGGVNANDRGIQTGIQVASSINYGINEWLAVGFSGGWQRFGVKGRTDDDSGVTTDSSRLNGYPLFCDVILRIPNTDKLNLGAATLLPYGVVGLGTVIWDLDDIKADIDGDPVHVDAKINSSVALKLGGGFDWFLTDEWLANVEASYVFDHARLKETFTQGGDEVADPKNEKLDFWTVGGGLKRRF